MQAIDIEQLAERLQASDLGEAHEQREIFERIREMRSALEGPLDPESQRRLEAAGMLVAYLAHMGVVAGEDVRTIAVRLLRGAADAERTATSLPPAVPATVARPTTRKITPSEERSATDLMSEMMLGQILFQRGQILEEHIRQAMKIQRVSPMRIGDIFVKIGACSRAQVVDALNHQASIRRLRDNLSESAPKLESPDIRGTGLRLVGEAMLGEILIERNLITRRQLERALEHQKQSGARIGEALVKLGATTLDQIESALLHQSRERRFSSKGASGPSSHGETKR